MKNTVGVVGLGYVGLPLAVQAAQHGYEVVGFDVDPHVVKMVNERKSPFVNDARFTEALSSLSHGALTVTTSTDLLASVDNVIICVPTPTRNNVPDLRLVQGATESVAQKLHSGQLVSLESTVNHGVTRGLVLPRLENMSGLKVGQDFYLAHCPERIDPGNRSLYVGNINRVVGGVTSACTERATDFYKSIIDAAITPLGSPEEAEFVKSGENSLRNVLIAMSNLFGQICDASGMDIGRVLGGLQSKIDQFGFGLAQPGIGPGGHCIPEDIHFVIAEARRRGVDTSVLEEAAALNDSMPSYAVHKLRNAMQEDGRRLEDSQVTLLGIAYKPNVADARRSPAVEVGYQLFRYADSLVVHDACIPDAPKYVKGSSGADSIAAALKGSEVVVVATAHDAYLEQVTPDLLRDAGVQYVLDGRNCLDKDEIVKQGITYIGIGK